MSRHVPPEAIRSGLRCPPRRQRRHLSHEECDLDRDSQLLVQNQSQAASASTSTSTSAAPQIPLDGSRPKAVAMPYGGGRKTKTTGLPPGTNHGREDQMRKSRALAALGQGMPSCTAQEGPTTRPREAPDSSPKTASGQGYRGSGRACRLTRFLASSSALISRFTIYGSAEFPAIHTAFSAVNVAATINNQATHIHQRAHPTSATRQTGASWLPEQPTTSKLHLGHPTD